MKATNSLANLLLLRDLHYLMHERQKIYLRRKRGRPWPWTDDKILQKYSFTHVYRELDRTTVWIRENWREPFADHPNLWFAMAVARQINWPPTLQEIGFPTTWKPNRTYRIMTERNTKERKARGEKVYGPAYRLGTNHPDKLDYTVNLTLDNLFRKADPKRLTDTSLESATKYLSQFYGFGNTAFIAYEVTTDLRHTRYLRDAPDIMTWANPGPGCVEGLNRLFERRLEAQPPRDSLIREMRSILSWMLENRDPKILPTLELRDIEMSLCEFNKYRRVVDARESGSKKPLGLRLYKPPARKILNLFGEEISLPRKKTA